MEKLDVIRYEGEGYRRMVDFGNWRVAFLLYAERFDKEYIQKMERHLLTDEVFVLLSGKAALVIGKEQKVCQLEKNTIYNVKKNVWHAVCVSRDAQILIVENADTSAENTEYIQIELNEADIPV